MAEQLSAKFFTEELPKLAEAFAKEEGAPEVYTDILLRDGITLRLEGQPVCTEAYIAFDHKAGAQKHRIILPYASIVGIGMSATGEKAGMGFK
ncbi:MAG TPA: hypothetical protein VGK74_23595 [Symbiobacteriaceae bacterium]|jgi:hypothetical protein